jgi:hypothetical protein
MNPIHTGRVQAAILEIRGQKVLLDQEVAKIYGVRPSGSMKPSGTTRRNFQPATSSRSPKPNGML